MAFYYSILQNCTALPTQTLQIITARNHVVNVFVRILHEAETSCLHS